MTCEDLEFASEEECILATARLILRRPSMADAAAVARLANDRTIAENTATIPHPYTLANAETWIANQADRTSGRSAFLAFAPEGERHVLVGAGGFGPPVGEDAPEIGYWVGAPFRDRGYATEIARALVDYAFERRRVERLLARSRVTNGASRRVLEKCGFQWFGVGLSASVGVGGAFPVDRFRLDRATWASLIGWRVARISTRKCDPELRT